MKKIISSLTTVLIAILMLPFGGALTASAEDYSQNGLTLTYTVSGSSASITGCSGNGTSLIIPELINGCSVVSIEKNAFSGCSGLVSVTIPDSIEDIGEKAFWSCTSLKTIYIGSGVSAIGDYAFSACPQLSSFSVSSSNSLYTALNGILYSKDGASLLYYAGSSSAFVPEGTKAIGKAAFFGNPLLTSVSLPSGLLTIGDYAFSGCFSLEKIMIPVTVTALGKGCFMNCSTMNQAVLGGGLTEIPEDCFSMCSSLESVNISASISAIGAQAFFGCTKLSGVYIPPTVISIGNDAVGTHYDIRSGKNAPIHGFYINGDVGSAVEQYARSAGVDFIDFANIPLGDVNGSGSLTAIDAAIVLTEYANVAVGKLPSFTYYQTLTGDYNLNGKIDIIDAAQILTRYAQMAIAP